MTLPQLPARARSEESHDVACALQHTDDLEGHVPWPVDDEELMHRPETQGFIGEVFPEMPHPGHLGQQVHRGVQLVLQPVRRGGPAGLRDVRLDLVEVGIGLRGELIAAHGRGRRPLAARRFRRALRAASPSISCPLRA